ncbi:MAG: transposase, partial [Actinomycetota bacterium]|nr:transposase [Actinomycetota bacterium]
ARRILELGEQISSLEEEMDRLSAQSEIARRTSTIPALREIAELAGEIGTLKGFSSGDSLASYLGMCPLDNQSGEYAGTKAPKQVNKHAKSAMMAAVARHIKMVPRPRAYYQKSWRRARSTTRRCGPWGVIWCGSSGVC